MTEIENRLNRLERRNRWLTAALVVLCSTLLMAYAMPQQQQKILRAQRFVVVDEDGVEQASLGNNGSPTLTLGALRDGEAGLSVLTPNFWTMAYPGKRIVMIWPDRMNFITGALDPLGAEATLDLRSKDDEGELVGPRFELRGSLPNQAAAIIGRTSLTTERTGVIENRPVGSIVLLNNDGSVVYKSP